MSGLKFSEDHEWLRVEADGAVTIGITDFAQNQLGDLVFIELPEVGSHFEQGEEAAVIESVKAAGDIRMPINGTVVATNQALVEDPSLVSQDPMGGGWFFKVTADRPEALDALMDEETYRKFVASLS